MRKLQTALTRIFIVLESVSHGLSKNSDEISRKARKFKGFSAENQVVSKKRKQKTKVFAEIESDFSAEIRNSKVFPPKIRWSPKTKVFAEIESDFSAEIRNSKVFPPKIRWSPKNKKKKTKKSSPKLSLILRPKSEIQTFEGGLFSYGGAIFNFSQIIGL